MHHGLNMHILKQPTSVTCGQTCVAMLAGVSVEDACAAVGTEGTTKTRQLVAGLQNLGLPCSGGLIRVRRVSGLVAQAIVKVAPPKGRGWHWVLWHGDSFVDPASGTRYSADAFHRLCGDWRVTSLLPVSPP